MSFRHRLQSTWQQQGEMAHVNLLTNAEWLTVARQRLRSDDQGIEADELQFVNVRPAAENGEYTGFIGDSLPVRACVRLSGGGEKELAFFIKTVPNDNEKHAELALRSGAFHKETELYAKVFPRMSVLISPSGSSKGSKTTTYMCYPRAFHTRPDTIVMEDLMEQGFIERNRRDSFDFDHIAIILEILGRFHASSFLLEEEIARESGRPCPLNQLYPGILEENMFLRDTSQPLGRWYAGTIRTLKNAVSLIPKYKTSPDYKNIVNKLSDVLNKNIDIVQPSKKYRNFLNHGDLWSNNMLFRYENGRPVDGRLLDFQLCRYCPPAIDINQLFQLTTRPSLREKHGAALLRRYHESLARTLASKGVDVQFVLPWEELVASCDELRTAGLVIGVSYQNISFITPEVLKSALSPENYEKFLFEDRDDIVARCFRDDKYYREVLSEQLCELVDVEVLGMNQGFWKRIVTKGEK